MLSPQEIKIIAYVLSMVLLGTVVQQCRTREEPSKSRSRSKASVFHYLRTDTQVLSLVQNRIR
jgi:hypothetical protein